MVSGKIVWGVGGLVLIVLGVFGALGRYHLSHKDALEGPILVTTGNMKSVNAHFLGVNAQLTEQGKTWAIPEMRDALIRTRVRHARFPGGTVSNYWDWREGWFNAEAPIVLKNRRQIRPYTLRDVRLAYEANEVIPVFVLNMLTDSLQSQLEMLFAAREMGLPIEYVELGNEFYLDRPDYVARYPEPERYVKEANRWIAAIKQKFPQASIGVVGAAPSRYQRTSERHREWNPSTVPRYEGADAITLHVYAFWESGRPAPIQGNWGSEALQKHQYQRLQVPEVVDQMLAQPFLYLKRIQEDTLLASMPLWVTEFNLFDQIGPVRGTWAHGLFVAAFLTGILALPNAELATYHAVTPNPMFSAFFITEEDYAGLEVKQVSTTPFALTASGHVLALFGAMLEGVHTATQLRFAPAPMIEIAGKQGYEALGGWLLQSETTARLLLVNFSGKPHILNLSEIEQHGWEVEVVSASPTTYITHPDSLTRDRLGLNAELLERFTLPPHAILVGTRVE